MPKGIDFTDRIGTVAEDVKDIQLVEKVSRNAFKSYEDEIVCRLPYVDTSGSTNTIGYVPGTGTLWQYKINSIYDCDLTGGGHQPLGRDTWASIYNYYKVLKTTIKVEFYDVSYDVTSSVGGSPPAPTIIGGLLDLTGTAPGSPTPWFEGYTMNGTNRQQLFSYPQICNPVGSRDKGIHTIEMEYTPDLFEKEVINSSGSTGWNAVGGDPLTLTYFSIVIHNPNAIANRYAYYRTWLEYTVAFKQVNRSLMMNTN